MESQLSYEPDNPVQSPHEVVVRNDLVQAGEEADPPQWVIMGIEIPSGVAVLASSTLTRAQMRRRFEDEVKAMGPLGKVRLRKEYDSVLFECNGFTFITGETYAECLRSLPHVWEPPEPRQQSQQGELEV